MCSNLISSSAVSSTAPIDVMGNASESRNSIRCDVAFKKPVEVNPVNQDEKFVRSILTDNRCDGFYFLDRKCIFSGASNVSAATPQIGMQDGSESKISAAASEIVFLQSPFTSKDPNSPVPRNRREAMNSDYWSDYYAAEQEEMQNHTKNLTWHLVPRSQVPKGATILRTKWVYDDKKGPDGSIVRFKARLTAMGCFQKAGDYFETFASVMRTKTFRVLLQILNAAEENSGEQWDIKAAFINAPLEEDIYVFQPDGHGVHGTEGMVCKLDKALYGLKQAGRAWQKFLSAILLECGFTPLMKDQAVFQCHGIDGGWCFIGTHVDDLFLVYNKAGKVLRDKVFEILASRVTVINLGDIKWALKTLVQRVPAAGILKISQAQYTQEIISRFGFQELKPAGTPAFDAGPLSIMTEQDLPMSAEETAANLKLHPFYEAIGCLWWLANISRPDIYFAVFKCSQFVSKPSRKLWLWVVRIFRYLVGDPDRGVVFTRPTLVDSDSDPPLLKGAVDASYADGITKRSTLGQLYWFLGGLIDWNSKMSTRVLDSSTDAECCSLVQFGKENAWLRGLLKELGIFKVNKPTIVLEDNTSSIALSGQGPTKRTRHFDISWYKFKEYVDLGEISLEYRNTHENPADFFTKALALTKFVYFRAMIMGGDDLQNFFKDY